MYPVFFTLGPITIRSLWLLLSVGFIVASILFIKNLKHLRLPMEFIWDKHILLISLSLLGSRLTFILLNYRIYLPLDSSGQILNLFSLWDQGLSLWGGIITFLGTFFYLAKKHKQEITKWMDAFVQPILAILLLGSIGDFLDGKNYGKETTLPWGVSFNSIDIKYTVPIHPTQIYSFIYILLIVFLIKKYKKSTPFLKENGITAVSSIWAYSFLRFFEELLKGDDTLYLLFLRLPQVLTLISLTLSSLYIHKRYKIFKNNINK